MTTMNPCDADAFRRDLIVRAGASPVAPIGLCAGPLTMEFDPATTFLRRLAWGEVEVIRGVYGAVRDRNWGTAQGLVTDLEHSIGADSFTLSFTVVAEPGGLPFTWRGQVVGDSTGRVRFRFEGEAQGGFWRNRIGLCVLHPLAGCVGQSCWITHGDGSVEATAFPILVAPHQPFRSVRQIAHEPVPGLRVEVTFEGEEFETEDQRNWTDASFKTYGTPLDLPFPVWVEPGTRVSQTVTVQVEERGQSCPPDTQHKPESRSADNPVRSTPSTVFKPGAPTREDRIETPRIELSALRSEEVDAGLIHLPPVGFVLAAEEPLPTGSAWKRLRRLRPSHLRLDLRFQQEGWESRLSGAGRLAVELHAVLHVALFLSGEVARELEALDAAVRKAFRRLPIGLWIVFEASGLGSPPALLEVAGPHLATIAPGVPLAAGTNANFAEWNRARPQASFPVLPCFSLNPQVHASDLRSLVENLEGQPASVECAAAGSGQRVVVSPVTLRPRFNAVATGADTFQSADLPPSVDPRQLSLFAAAWTVGSLAALAGLTRVHSLTYYETTGWRGLMERDQAGSRGPRFPSRPGEVFPVYHVFAAMVGTTGVKPLTFSCATGIVGMWLMQSEGLSRLLVANLDSRTHTLQVPWKSEVAVLRLLDAIHVDRAMADPEGFWERPDRVVTASQGNVECALEPFAVVILDTGELQEGTQGSQ